MKTFKNPSTSNIGEFTYEGCRYDGIPAGMTFSVLSEGLADYLMETFPFLVQTDTAPVADNIYCCSKCGKDCHSEYMKKRHEKVCKEEPKGMATILKPNYIFWKYAGLDRSQLTEDQLIPDIAPIQPVFNERDITEPMPGRAGTAMIGRTLQQVVTDREGVDWYGEGLVDDFVGK